MKAAARVKGSDLCRRVERLRRAADHATLKHGVVNMEWRVRPLRDRLADVDTLLADLRSIEQAVIVYRNQLIAEAK